MPEDSGCNVDEFLRQCRGCLISADCGDGGYYQGLLRDVKPLQSIDLDKPLKDGIPLRVPFISLSSNIIRDVKVVKIQPAAPSANMRAAKKSTAVDTSSTRNTKEVTEEKKKSAGAYKPANSPKADKTRLSCSSPAGFSVVASNQLPLSQPAISPASMPSKKSGVTGTRISVKQLLNMQDGSVSSPSAAGKDKDNATDTALKYNKYGDFRHFTEPQMPAPPCRLNFAKRNASSHGPSGIPLLDASNGYSGYKANNAELNEPIDFNVLNTDFDFDSNLAIFKRSMSEEGLSSGADGAADSIRLVKRNFRNDENVLSDPSRVTSWVAALVGTDGSHKTVATVDKADIDNNGVGASVAEPQPSGHDATFVDGIEPSVDAEFAEAKAREFMHEFRNCHISVDCGPDGYYQGLLRNVKYQAGVEISRPLRNGVPLDVPFIALLTSSIRDVKVVKISANSSSEVEPEVAKNEAQVDPGEKKEPMKNEEKTMKPNQSTKPLVAAEPAPATSSKMSTMPTDTANAGKTVSPAKSGSFSSFSIEAIPVSVLRGKSSASKQPTAAGHIQPTKPAAKKESASAASPAALSAAATRSASSTASGKPKKAVAGTRITVKQLLNMKEQQQKSGQ